MMNRILFLLLISLVLATTVLAQPRGPVRLTDETVVKDSAGTVYNASIWKALLATGQYKIQRIVDPAKDTVFLLMRLSEKEQKLRNDNLPKPRESPFFTTGKTPRSFTAIDMDGNKYKLKDLAGKVVVLNFWFVNCGPCRREIPELNKLADDYKDSSNIVFLAIGLDDESSIEKFLEVMPFSYKMIGNGRSVSSIYGVTSYPTHAIIDKAGKVIFHATGFGPATIPWLRKTIEKALL